MMRALMLWNPEAAGMSPHVLTVITRALEAELKLDVAPTEHRRHAIELARAAADGGYDAVVCLGGDGTLNEVINGLAGTDVPIIPLPGGGTNVFARSVGLPKDPIEATGVVLERLQAGATPRAISLGRVNDRWFAFCSGVGVDAAIVRDVDRRFRLKKKIGEPFFVAQGLATWTVGFPYRGRPITVDVPGERIDGMRSVVVGNTSPYTFLGRRGFHLAPGASLEGAMTMLCTRSLSPLTVTRLILTAFGKQKMDTFRNVQVRRDVSEVRVTSTVPMPWQVDGEYGGESTTFEYRNVPGALRVLP